jgi:hypothetical protein
MSRYSAARASRLTVESGGVRPIFDIGDALSVNVSESCLTGRELAAPADQSFASRDEAEQSRDSKKP